MLTDKDLKAIAKLIDDRITSSEKRQDEKLDRKFDQKLKPIYEFVEFAKPAIVSLLEEADERHNQKLPERVERLEKLVKNN